MASARGAGNITPIGARTGGSTGYLYTEQAQAQLAWTLTTLVEPDEVLKKANIARTALRKLDSDDEISSALDTRVEAAVGSIWRLEPDPKGAATGERIKEQVWTELEPHLETLLRGGWDALPYGYAVNELVYEQRPASAERLGIGLNRVTIKPFQWFAPQPDDRLIYRPQHGEDVEVPWRVNLEHEDPELRIPKYMLTRRAPTYEQPQGKALLSRLYWAWFFRQRGWQFWGRFLERHAGPLLHGQQAALPGETSEDFGKRLDDFTERLVDAHNNAVVVTGADDNVNAIAAGTAGDAYDKFEIAVNKRVQKVVLGQTLTSDVTKVGSYAASKTHNLVREDRRRADMRMLTTPVQTVVDALTLLNFGPNVVSPTFTLEEERGVQVERATRDSELLRAGLPLTKAYFMRRYEFEDDEIDPDDPLVPLKPGGGAGAQAMLAANLGTASGIERLVRQQQASVDRLIRKATGAGPAPLEPDDVVAAIRAAKGPEDLAERLLALVPRELEDDDGLRELIERSLFAADLMGYVQTEQQ